MSRCCKCDHDWPADNRLVPLSDVCPRVCVCLCVHVRLQRARHQVYHLALQCFNQPPVAAASVCFCELLGVCSLQLRVDVRALNTVLQHRNTHAAEGQHAHTLGRHTAHARAHSKHTLQRVSQHAEVFLSVFQLL